MLGRKSYDGSEVQVAKLRHSSDTRGYYKSVFRKDLVENQAVSMKIA